MGPLTNKYVIIRAFEKKQAKDRKAAAVTALAAEATAEDLIARAKEAEATAEDLRARAEEARLKAEAARADLAKSQAEQKALQEMADASLRIRQQLEEEIMLNRVEQEAKMQQAAKAAQAAAATAPFVQTPPRPPPRPAPCAPPPHYMGNYFAFTGYSIPAHVWELLGVSDGAWMGMIERSYAHGAMTFLKFYGLPPVSFRVNAHPSSQGVIPTDMFEFSAPGYGRVVSAPLDPSTGQATAGFLLDDSFGRYFLYNVDITGHQWMFNSVQRLLRDMPDDLVRYLNLTIPPPPPPSLPGCTRKGRRG